MQKNRESDNFTQEFPVLKWTMLSPNLMAEVEEEVMLEEEFMMLT